MATRSTERGPRSKLKIGTQDDVIIKSESYHNNKKESIHNFGALLRFDVKGNLPPSRRPSWQLMGPSRKYVRFEGQRVGKVKRALVRTG